MNSDQNQQLTDIINCAIAYVNGFPELKQASTHSIQHFPRFSPYLRAARSAAYIRVNTPYSMIARLLLSSYYTPTLVLRGHENGSSKKLDCLKCSSIPTYCQLLMQVYTKAFLTSLWPMLLEVPLGIACDINPLLHYPCKRQ